MFLIFKFTKHILPLPRNVVFVYEKLKPQSFELQVIRTPLQALLIHIRITINKVKIMSKTNLEIDMQYVDIANNKHLENEKYSAKEIADFQRNRSYAYFEREEKLNGFLSQQFPTIANPAPLGLCAFALTTFVLSMMNAGAIVDVRAPSQGVVLGLALFYGGLVQLLAGMWEFKTGNTLGALLFSSYGGFWMSFAVLFIDSFGFLAHYGTNEQALNNDLGIYLLAWAFFTIIAFLAAHRTTIALTSLLFVLFWAFLMLSIGRFNGNNVHYQKAGGIFGIIAAAIAWYCAIAGVLTKKNSLFTLPVGEMDTIYKKLGWLSEENITK